MNRYLGDPPKQGKAKVKDMNMNLMLPTIVRYVFHSDGKSNSNQLSQ